MLLVMSFAVFVCGPLGAAALPWLLRGTRVSPFFRALTRKAAPAHCRPLAIPQPDEPVESPIEQWGVVPGAILGSGVIFAYLLYGAGPSSSLERTLVLRDAFLTGLTLGLAAYTVAVFVRRARLERRAAQGLLGLGIQGTWDAGENNEVPFRSELLQQLTESRTLDAIGVDGETIFGLLSNPQGAWGEFPDRALRGARIRLLLLPPRSYRVDPERRRLTCAEEALSRLQRSPEEHWRRLHQSLEVRNRWAEEQGICIDLRFLDERPAFNVLLTGQRGWFRPWGQEAGSWIEIGENEQTSSASRSPSAQSQVLQAINDSFVGSWSVARDELAFPLTPGPTSSSFIRKGVPRKSAEAELENPLGELLKETPTLTLD